MNLPFTTKAQALRTLGRNAQDLIEAGFLIRIESVGGNGEYSEKTVRLTVFRSDKTAKGKWYETRFYGWL